MSIPEHELMSDLIQTLATCDALDAFQRLSLDEQARFLAWIEKASDEEAHWRRIDILVLGMRMAPLSPSSVATIPTVPAESWANPIGRG